MEGNKPTAYHPGVEVCEVGQNILILVRAVEKQQVYGRGPEQGSLSRRTHQRDDVLGNAATLHVVYECLVETATLPEYLI